MSKRRILVVDDEPHVARILRMRLEGAGYEVSVAGDGQEALEQLREQRFDLVLTDITMPRLDGRALCERVRDEEGEHGPYIFVITSRAEDDERDWTRDHPRLELVEKPVSLRRLLARVEQCFEKQDAEDAS